MIGNKVVLCLGLMTDLYKSIYLVLEIVILWDALNMAASLPVIVAPCVCFLVGQAISD
jgi:hypothetical protein